MILVLRLILPGPLGYMHQMTPENAKTIQFALGVNFDHELREQQYALEMRRLGLPHPPFRFRIFGNNFFTAFM